MSLFSIFKIQMIFLNIQQNGLISPWDCQLPAHSLPGISRDPNTIFYLVFYTTQFEYSAYFSSIALTFFTKFSFSSV